MISVLIEAPTVEASDNLQGCTQAARQGSLKMPSDQSDTYTHVAAAPKAGAQNQSPQE